MKIKLQNICHISTGVYVKTERIGDVYYIQARDFDKYLNLELGLKPEIYSGNINNNHYLKSGDIIIAAKGFHHFAFTFKEQVMPAVASSMFIVLRQIDRNKAIPDFITWYINHPKTQTHLSRVSKGSSLPSINKSIIGELEISIPSLEKQELILTISKLRVEESRLKECIEDLKDDLINEKLINILKY
ncbi:restriction endonuclease subunit S [Yeosuana marina]|uniref:restriction endonuclease subunit S n=1 Tax=Yeosuana marina TaxID=1565536 RepID=UPI0030C7D401